jgi:integrase
METVLPNVSRQVAAMIQMQWLTGMRPGEVVTMRTADLDMSGKTWIYVPVQHKTLHHGKERIIPIGPKGQLVLRSFLKLDREAFLFDPREADAEHRDDRAHKRVSRRTPSQKARHERVMEAPQRSFNDRYSVLTYARAVTRGCTKGRVSPWTPNQLRHSAATRIRKEHGIEAARVILGHASVTTTEIYAEVNREAAIRIMEQSG